MNRMYAAAETATDIQAMVGSFHEQRLACDLSGELQAG
jgi:hypothetical protein